MSAITEGLERIQADLRDVKHDGPVEPAWLKTANADIHLGFHQRLYAESRMDEAQA